MKILYTYIPFQMLLGVVIGILFPVINIYICIPVFLVLVLLYAYYSFKKSGCILGVIVCSAYILSCLSQFLNNDLNRKNHYSHFPNQNKNIVLVLTTKLKSSKLNQRFYAKVKRIDSINVMGSVIVTLPKTNRVEIGDILFTTAPLKSINQPTSPYDFSYKNYLKKRNIYSKIYLKEYVKINKSTSVLLELQKLRTQIETLLVESKISISTQSIMMAMLLGDREFLTVETEQSFINSGVVHLIAISGMHIGVLYLLLSYTFSFLKYFKYGNYLHVVLVLFLLIGFAVFSGLSSSVVRSVTMFGFVLLAKLKRNTGLLLEPIVTSALILLLCQPNYLFDAGFQLSYVAVIAIVTFYPMVVRSILIKNRVLKYFVDVLIVSIIAQLGVLAISLYYFQQFSFQFLVANFFAVSLLPIVLYGGFMTLIKVLWSPGYSILECCYDSFISFYLNGINYFSSFRTLVFTEISVSEIQVFSYYILLIMVWALIKYKTYILVKILLIQVIVFQLISVFMNYNCLHKKELIIYNTYKKALVSIKQSNKLYVSKGYNELDVKKNYIKNDIATVVELNKDVFYFNKYTYLFIKENFNCSSLNLDSVILVLDGNPKINLERVLLNLKPEKVIFCASTFNSNLIKWKSTCKQLQVPFYNIKKKGAYVVKL